METPTAMDPIALEVLRSRLAATAEEGGLTIERTAISPVITESRDYACTLLEANGDLIIGGGNVSHQWGVCGHAVRATMKLHGATVAPGDVFFANDPHNGGGEHAQDVLIQRPVFADDQLIAWVVNEGHMVDMGGLVFGSWSSAATDCYQEALRLPPVRLFRQGVEQPDIWSVIRNNVRVPDIVEMDLRALVAGCHVAQEKLVALAQSMGVEHFLCGVGALRVLAEQEMRRRISALEDGLYRFTTWVEWGKERYKVPCELTVEGDTMTFDFKGAPPQTEHFFNSKPHIIAAQVIGDGSDILAYDLPLSQGMFAPITVRCPEGSIVNSQPPAPIASAHIDVAFNASMAAQQCMMMALTASGEVPGKHLVCGPLATTSVAVQIWAYQTSAGRPDGWMMLDGSLPGGSAAADRDGSDFFMFMASRHPKIEGLDVEILESWYPVLVLGKQPRSGTYGAGRYRSGAGLQMSFKPYGTDRLLGSLLAVREYLPLPGMAGGFPGATSEFDVRRTDGTLETIDGKTPNLVLHEGETIEFRLGSAGGYGDPVDREAAAVARDVRLERITPEGAAEVYGVVVLNGSLDEVATRKRRAAILAARLAAARAPLKPFDRSMLPAVTTNGGALPLYPGVEQRGTVAFASVSGTPLAAAPDDWANGCAVLSQPLAHSIVVESYLDPETGRALLVEVKPAGEGRTIEAVPRRWSDTKTRHPDVRSSDRLLLPS